VRKLRSVQVLRGVAAVAVVVHHACAAQGPARVGAAGVDLFFVISGLIMAAVGANRRPGEFLADRARRILPMWWIALVPWLMLRPHGFAAIASSVALWPIYGNGFHQPILGVGWTLCFEMLFYAAFALALATRWWVPVCAFAIVLLAPKSGNALIEYLGSPLIMEFLLGALIWRLPRNFTAGAFALAAGILAFALAPVWFGAEAFGAPAFTRMICWGIPSALLVYGALALDKHFAAPAFALPLFLGDASYSIYLFHRIVAQLDNWMVGILLSLALGCAVYWFVERPIVAAGRHRLTRRRPPVLAPLAAEAPTSGV
jgi:exopolysaccharide production protein ExoZ